ncbi:hypothetical protein LMG28727_04865 [Paraburkholderia kirstenboschensis]|uniref:aspartyl/asparaginyl beta-hydroxylase domain-containing protein n=1 Tax=Paraburkholderia kirstenboschensis TaxID=1245436 RepID=UPI000ACA4CEA|nr:aspartyl/asparaginyl beta-hydroxylase domain-containing protein [Paraburkholderia kirstenboschensis]CAD6548626.1 hypothetical protein LMG28727_04865 [Paraburkholderia kirstenboschensis]
MRHFLQIASGVDVAPLMSAIDAQPDLWDAHRERKESDGTPHARMSDIWVRYNDKSRYQDRESFNAEHVPVWYPAWHALPQMRPIIFDLMAKVQGEMLGGVLITRIPPGGGIAAHVDRGWHVEYYDKFYVSLRSAPGAEFFCDHDGTTEALNPKEGEIWRFDNRKNHWVENNSKIDRVTLIVCIRTDKYK